jgi:Phospholipid methyltransferase
MPAAPGMCLLGAPCAEKPDLHDHLPGTGAVYAPWWILTRGSANPKPLVWTAGAFCLCDRRAWTPGPWDAPRRFVDAGPYRWARNPIYVGALLVLVGEAWLFPSLALFLYAGAVAVGFHLFVVWYEEPAVRPDFGDEYNGYCRSVSRWTLRPPTEDPTAPRPEANSRDQLSDARLAL